MLVRLFQFLNCLVQLLNREVVFLVDGSAEKLVQQLRKVFLPLRGYDFQHFSQVNTHPNVRGRWLLFPSHAIKSSDHDTTHQELSSVTQYKLTT